MKYGGILCDREVAEEIGAGRAVQINNQAVLDSLTENRVAVETSDMPSLDRGC